jgi:hypothetical protein
MRFPRRVCSTNERYHPAGLIFSTLEGQWSLGCACQAQSSAPAWYAVQLLTRRSNGLFRGARRDLEAGGVLKLTTQGRNPSFLLVRLQS